MDANKMENEEKVQRTLDFIERDRSLADDPFFTTRLMARTEKYFSSAGTVAYIPLLIKLRPYLAAAVVIIGILAGIAAGTGLDRIPGNDKVVQRTVRLQEFAQEEYLSEIAAPVEEEILSTK